MSTSIIFALDTRKAKADKTYPVVMRIIHKRKARAIPTGHSCTKHDWDASKREFKRSYKGVSSVARLNNLLASKRNAAMDIVIDLERNGRLEQMAINDLKSIIVGVTTSKHDVYSYTEFLIEDMLEQGKVGNARSHRCMLMSLRKYHSGKSLPFADVSYRFLNILETKYLAAGNSINGLAVYLRTLRSVMNKAIKEGIIERSSYPFSDYVIKTRPTRKRAISVDDIKKLLAADPGERQSLRLTLDLFTCSFYLMGMNVSDLLRLQVSDIKNGRVYYSRAKTSREYDVQAPEPVLDIFKMRCANKGGDEYVFPVIKSSDEQGVYRDIVEARARYNGWLRELAAQVGIESHITSYTSRHSFASQAKKLGIPVVAIQEMLGHSSITTTQAYLESLTSEVRDNYHASVVNLD